MSPRIIAIMNQKGGVGKTTTVLNLGASLAHQGKRVLLIDLDPQANLTRGLDLRADGLEDSVYVLLTEKNPKLEGLIRKTQWENLDLIPSHIDLSGAELEMVTMLGRETRLREALLPVIDQYDYIFIDCLPSLSLLTVNAMVFAKEILVPLQAHPFAMEGLGKLFEVAGMVREAMNPKLQINGVVITLYDGRTNVARESIAKLKADERLCDHLFYTRIKSNIKIAESQKNGIPITHFDKNCHGAEAYMALSREVLEMETGNCTASEAGRKLFGTHDDKDPVVKQVASNPEPNSEEPIVEQPKAKQEVPVEAPKIEKPVAPEQPTVEPIEPSRVVASVVSAPTPSTAPIAQPTPPAPSVSNPVVESPKMESTSAVPTNNPTGRPAAFYDSTKLADTTYRPRLGMVPNSAPISLPSELGPLPGGSFSADTGRIS